MATVPYPSEKPTVPIWPDAAAALGIRSKSAAYRAARLGTIPTVQLSERRWVVPTAALRAMLGLPIEEGSPARDSA